MSSLITSDIYHMYINKNATQKELLTVVRVSSVVIAIIIVIATILLQKVSLLTAILTAGGFVGAPFFPIVLGLWWKKTSTVAVVTAITVSVLLVSFFLLTGIIPQWIAYLTCILVSLILTVVISLIKPDNFDFSKLKSA